MATNGAGREIPSRVPGIDGIRPYEGAYAHTPLIRREKGSRTLPRLNKLVDTLEDAIERTGLKDGMTISFHHHFREGDVLTNQVLEIVANLGIKNLTLASSSLTSVHTPVIEHVRSGVIRRIVTSGLRGDLGDAVSRGLLEIPVLIHSHGGRARAVESGQLHIDVAFLGVPASDLYGNANGFAGKSACGSLGYAIVDSQNADKVVLITDNLTDYPNTPFSIDQDHVDHIVVVDSVGNPQKISTGATRMTQDPRELLIARLASDTIAASGYFEDNFSFQTGSGGAALAVTKFLREKMLEREIKASFVLGGITSQIVKLHEEGLVKRVLDVQSFDMDAIRSSGENRYHTEIDASFYANPLNKGCVANKLNVVVLSAMEIDSAFNVNVITGSDGVIRGASGGHSDTAIGSGLSVIVAPLVRGRTPTIVDSVTTIITPGESVDVFVTDHGLAVNPRRPEVEERLRAARLPVYTIAQLQEKAERMTGKPEPIKFGKRIVGLVEYRDGTILDVIREVV